MRNLPREREMRASEAPETKQGRREWMATDFPDLLRLGCNSSILFMGKFSYDHTMCYLVLKLDEYISFVGIIFQDTRPRILYFHPS